MYEIEIVITTMDETWLPHSGTDDGKFSKVVEGRTV